MRPCTPIALGGTHSRRMRYVRLSRKRACLYLPNRRRFVSVWSRAYALVRRESPGEMIQEEMEQLRAIDARQHSQLKKTG